MARTTWGPLSTDEQNQIEFAPVGEPGVLVAGTAGGLLKRNADGTIGNSILSESGSVLTAAGRLVISGGMVTASTPVLDLSQTWNLAGTTFTGINFDVTDSASSFSSRLLRIRVGGSEVFGVTKVGTVVASTFQGTSSGSFNFNSDTYLVRGAANTLDLRNSTAAQTWNVYGTYTDASNYRRIRTTMTTGGAATIAAEGLGTGATGNSLELGVNGTTRLSINASGSLTIDATVNVGTARNFLYDTTTGTKHGTATTQKLGFWNATPIVQPSSTGETVGFTAGGGTTVTDASTFTGNVGATAYRISDIVKALKNSGLIAS